MKIKLCNKCNNFKVERTVCPCGFLLWQKRPEYEITLIVVTCTKGTVRLVERLSFFEILYWIQDAKLRRTAVAYLQTSVLCFVPPRNDLWSWGAMIKYSTTKASFIWTILPSSSLMHQVKILVEKTLGGSYILQL